MKNRIGSKSPLSKELLLVVIGAAVALGPAGMGLINSRFAAAPVSLIPVRMQEFVDRHQAAGIVTLVARHGDLKEFDAVGYQDLETNKPMRKDSIFQIMSMTKPITCVGVMVLEEEGKLSVGAPVARYLPEFDGKNITLRVPLAEAVRFYGRQHLQFEPGTRWRYSNMGIAALGRIVEVVTGEDYVHFIESRLLTPLGMQDTFFFPPDAKKDRIALVYKHSAGKLVRSGDEILAGDSAKYRAGAKYPAPEFGLYSTAPDLFNFYEMLLEGGTYKDHRYLSRQSIDTMTRVFTPDVSPSGWLGGTGYGLTFEIVNRPEGTLLLHSPGTFGHGGAFGTEGWIDPHNNLIRISMVQLSDGTGSHARSVIMQIGESAVQ